MDSGLAWRREKRENLARYSMIYVFMEKYHFQVSRYLTRECSKVYNKIYYDILLRFSCKVQVFVNKAKLKYYDKYCDLRKILLDYVSHF